MTARDTVRMVTAFTAGDGKKPYATKLQAYYAIAKALVVEKYPAWLTSEGDREYRSLVPVPFSQRTIELRTAKSFDLFWHQDPGRDGARIPIYFDENKWKAFVRRVAKYLQYVDERHQMLAQLAHLPDDALQERYEYCESKGTAFMELAIFCRTELARRADARREWSTEINTKLDEDSE